MLCPSYLENVKVQFKKSIWQVSDMKIRMLIAFACQFFCPIATYNQHLGVVTFLHMKHIGWIPVTIRSKHLVVVTLFALKHPGVVPHH